MSIKNVCFLGHGDSGKTTMVEAILYKTGKVKRIGEVADGTTICDYLPEEKERKFSIELATCYTEWKNTTINIIDTPGYPDFIAEAISGIYASDFCFLNIHSTSGVMVNTRKLWRILENVKKPMAIVITKTDFENIDLDGLLSSIREQLSEKVFLFNIPDTTGSNIKRVINLVSPNLDEVPASIKSKVDEYHHLLKEAVVETDETLMEKYLDTGKVELNELQNALKEAIKTRKCFPILCTSVPKDVGVEELIDFIVQYAPAFEDLSEVKIISKANNEERNVKLSEINYPLGYAFKCVSDPYVGKISFIKMYGGEINDGDTITNVRLAKSVKIPKVFKVFGKEQRAVGKLTKGDIGVITKLEELVVSDTISSTGTDFLPVIEYPQPMVSLAVEPKSRSDEQRLTTSLARISDSDPTFKVERHKETLELVISGISNLHLEVSLAKMKRLYQVEIVTHKPKIPYKETITSSAEGHYKHKKQTGGHGQYGEVYLKIEPAERGKGFEFIDAIKGGAIPNQYIPAVEKGVREVLDNGVLAGYQIVDVIVTVFDGTYHVVDSSEASFKIAAAKAFQEAFLKAKPVLLEPIVNIEVVVPSKFTGDITSDLNSRRGRIMGMDAAGAFTVIKAQVPLAEIIDYSTNLRSTTAGEGDYSIQFSHYDLVPSNLQAQIVEKARLEKEKENK